MFVDAETLKLCDNEYFKLVYNFKMRAKDRSNEDVFIGIIDLEKTEIEGKDNSKNDYMQNLLDIVCHKLRKGDVITKWNEDQVLLLLSGLKEENIEILIKRINYHFYSISKNIKIKLNIRFQRL